jgi:RNA polymerase sigma-70 factor, ECF subfamily
MMMMMATTLSEIEDCIPALRRYAAGLLRSRAEADDLVHDCLVRALDHLHTRTGEGDIRNWLFSIMHNLFVSQKRRAARRPDAMSLDQAGEADFAVAGGQEEAIRWKELTRAFEQLPEDQRTVVLLIFAGDLNYAQAADVLGVPVGTVMSRLSRARERLRQSTEQPARLPLRRVK